MTIESTRRTESNTCDVEVVDVFRSTDGISVKLIQAVNTGPIRATFETGRYIVLDEDRGGEDIVCISSQIGCAMACTFCKTTEPYEYYPGSLLRILRSLTADEMVREVDNALDRVPPKDPTKIVFSFMGMGEPLANKKAVQAAIVTLGNKFPTGRATVCTIGHNLQAIRELADEVAQGHHPIPVKLHISLHGSNDKTRKSIVPYAKPIEDTITTAEYYAAATGHTVKLNYVLVKGVNSSDQDAASLGMLLNDRKNLILKISDLNPPTSTGFVDDVFADRFESIVRDFGVRTCRFTSCGTDIQAGCGELVKGSKI